MSAARPVSGTRPGRGSAMEAGFETRSAKSIVAHPFPPEDKNETTLGVVAIGALSVHHPVFWGKQRELRLGETDASWIGECIGFVLPCGYS